MSSNYNLKTKSSNHKNTFKALIISLIILSIIVIIIMFALQVFDIIKFNNKSFEEAGITYTPKQEEQDPKRLLTLINDDNPIPDDFLLNLVNYSDEIQVDSYVRDPLTEMLNDANASGYQIVVIGGYVNEEQQQDSFDEQVQTYINQGLSSIKAISKANKISSQGKYSDREIGLSVILNEKDNEKEFENTNSYKWLKDNCANYGFIIRYPKDKDMYTGKEFNPNYFRYIGKDNALKMRTLDMCLEQYSSYTQLREN